MEDVRNSNSSNLGGADSPGADSDSIYSSTEEMIEEGKAAAIFAYVPFLCFIPLIKMRHNKFAFRHGKQGLLLLCSEILAVFFMFDIISNLFWGIVLILSVGFAAAGVFYSLQGKEFTVPVVGQHVDRLKI